MTDFDATGLVFEFSSFIYALHAASLFSPPLSSQFVLLFRCSTASRLIKKKIMFSFNQIKYKR